MSFWDKLQDYFEDVLGTIREKYRDVIHGNIEHEHTPMAMAIKSAPGPNGKENVLGTTVKVVRKKLIDAERLLLIDKNGFLIVTLIVSSVCVSILLFLAVARSSDRKKSTTRHRSSALTERVARRKKRFTAQKQSDEGFFALDCYDSEWNDTQCIQPDNDLLQDALLVDSNDEDSTAIVEELNDEQPINSNRYIISCMGELAQVEFPAEQAAPITIEDALQLPAEEQKEMHEDIEVTMKKSIDNLSEKVESTQLKTQYSTHCIGLPIGSDTYVLLERNADKVEHIVNCQKIDKAVQVDDFIFFGFIDEMQNHLYNVKRHLQGTDSIQSQKVEVNNQHVQTDVELGKNNLVLVAKDTQTEYSYLTQATPSDLQLNREFKERKCLRAPAVSRSKTILGAAWADHNVNIYKGASVKIEKKIPPPVPYKYKSTQDLTKTEDILNINGRIVVQNDAIFKSRSLMFFNSRKNIQIIQPNKFDTQHNENAEKKEDPSIAINQTPLQNIDTKVGQERETDEEHVPNSTDLNDEEINAHGDEARDSSMVEQSSKSEGTASETIGDGPDAADLIKLNDHLLRNAPRTESCKHAVELNKFLTDICKPKDAGETKRVNFLIAPTDNANTVDKAECPIDTLAPDDNNENADMEQGSDQNEKLNNVKNEFSNEAGKLRLTAANTANTTNNGPNNVTANHTSINKKTPKPFEKQQLDSEAPSQHICRPSAATRLLNAARINIRDPTARDENYSGYANTIYKGSSKSRIPIPTGRKQLSAERANHAPARNLTGKTSALRRPSSVTPPKTSFDALGRRIPLAQRSITSLNLPTYTKAKSLQRPTNVRTKESQDKLKRVQLPAVPVPATAKAAA